MAIFKDIGLAGYETGTTNGYDGVIASDAHIETLPGVIAGGQGVLEAFTVMGKVTATGKYVKSVATANDGSQVPVRLLGFKVDTTAGDSTKGMIIAGCFNVDALVFDASFDTDAKKLAAFSSGVLTAKKLGPVVY